MDHLIKTSAVVARAAEPCVAISSRERYRQHADLALLTRKLRDPHQLVQWVCISCLVFVPLILSLESAPA